MTPRARLRGRRLALAMVNVVIVAVAVACRMATAPSSPGSPAGTASVPALAQCTPERVNETTGVCPAGQSCLCDWAGMTVLGCGCKSPPEVAGCLDPAAACKPPTRCCQLAVLHAPWYCATPAEQADAGGFLDCPEWEGGAP